MVTPLIGPLLVSLHLGTPTVITLLTRHLHLGLPLLFVAGTVSFREIVVPIVLFGPLEIILEENPAPTRHIE